MPPNGTFGATSACLLMNTVPASSLAATAADTAPVGVHGRLFVLLVRPVPPAAITVLLVQLIDCPDPLHVHPVPVAEAYVIPAGSVSVTVIVPLVAPVPVLLTVTVYVPVCPCVKLAP